MKKLYAPTFFSLPLVIFLTLALEYQNTAEAANVRGQCLSQYTKLYLKGPLHKAFASTGTMVELKTRTNRIACGGTDSWPSQKSATREALKICERVKRRSGISGTCRVIDMH
jgi:hypothetical protein